MPENATAERYLDGIADKLDDPDAYVRFLERKLQRPDPDSEPTVREAAIDPTEAARILGE